MTTEAWIAFGSLLFVIASGGATVIWKLASNKAEIIDRINNSKSSIYKEVDKLAADWKRELEVVAREAAEPIFAIREKVGQVELYIRDTYITKREYEKDHAQLLIVLRDMQEALEKRLDAHEDRVKEALEVAGKRRVVRGRG